MITGLFDSALTNFLGTAITKWNDNQTFKNVRLSIRDRLKREARLNAELLHQIQNKETVVAELTTIALQQVFEMPIPLNKILDKDLKPETIKILNKNKNYKRWTANIQNEADLVERLWQRTRMLEIHFKYDQKKPNVNYVCILNRALATNLV